VLVLAGVGVVALGFLLRLNPLPVVAAAALVTGLAAGLGPLAVLDAFGRAFNDARFVSVAYLVLPVVGLLERSGLRARAAGLVARFAGLTLGRLLLGYLLFRQLTAALGLISVGGHAQTVRPLVAPMAEAAAGDGADAERVRAMAAATDNVGLFFGEDVFLAIGSILLMKGVLDGMGIVLEPWQLSLWAVPSAAAALLVHGGRLLLLDRRAGRGKGR